MLFCVHLVEDVPLPVIGGALYLEDGVPLLQGAVVPHRPEHPGEPALPDQLAHAEGVAAPGHAGAGLEGGQARGGPEIYVARVLTGKSIIITLVTGYGSLTWVGWGRRFSVSLLWAAGM